MRIRNFFVTSALCVTALSLPLIAYKGFDETKSYSESFLLNKINSDQQKRCAGPCGGLYVVSTDPKISQFYVISPKDEKNIRWDKYCKSCRKIFKNNKKNLLKNTDANTEFGINIESCCKKSVAPPELLKSELLEAHKKPPTMIEEKILYNGNSTKEGIINFNKFVSVLLEEYGRQVGASVYVKGKRS